jgi:hypothetical protein
MRESVFTVAAWVTSVGAILGWSLVLVELVLGPISPVNPWLLAMTFALVAPPVGQMSRGLTPADAETKSNQDGGGA